MPNKGASSSYPASPDNRKGDDRATVRSRNKEVKSRHKADKKRKVNANPHG